MHITKTNEIISEGSFGFDMNMGKCDLIQVQKNTKKEILSRRMEMERKSSGLWGFAFLY